MCWLWFLQTLTRRGDRCVLQLVFAVDMLINTLESVMENFGLDPNAGALYVMQPGTTAASVGTVVAASVTHSPRNGVFHPNGQVVGIDSNSSLIQQSAGAINASLVRPVHA